MDIYEVNQELESAKRRAFRILERSPKTEKQLKDKLISDKKYSQETISLVIDFLKEYRYLDDWQFSFDYINSRINSKGLKILLYELSRKGIDELIIEEMRDEYSEFDPSEAIKSLIKKKGINPRTSDIKEREKLYRFLLSKGFNYSDVSKFFSESYCE